MSAAPKRIEDETPSLLASAAASSGKIDSGVWPSGRTNDAASKRGRAAFRLHLRADAIMPMQFARGLVPCFCLVLWRISLAPAGALPQPRLEQVGQARYLGDWFLMAHPPSRRDVGALNAQERHALAAGGGIAITAHHPRGEPSLPQHSRMRDLPNLST